jgi:hypothetical protein
MATIIGAVGVNLPVPQALFPIIAGGFLPDLIGTNRVSLSAGEDFTLPAGRFLVSPGIVSQIQVFDPVTTTWFPYTTQMVNEAVTVESDGQNYRVINPTGFPIGAVVTNSGTGYTAAPTVTVAGGQGSTWIALTGGALSTIVPAAAGSGSGYTVPPILNIAVPPAPGVPATATCTISGGTITTITIVNPGAGYTAVPAVYVIPQASDTNFNSLTSTVATKNAVLTASLSFAGNVTAILMTNEGTQPQNVAPALTIAAATGFAGSGALATAILAQSIQNITVTTPGSGFSGAIGISTFGGSLFSQTSGTGVTLLANNIVQSGLLIPRQAQIAGTIGSGSGVAILGNNVTGTVGSAIIDPGFFTAAPTAFVLPGPLQSSGTGMGVVVNPTLALTMGGITDTVYVQPL